MKINREVVTYILFGILTTIVNIGTYVGLIKILHIDYKVAVIIAWLISVLFAFFTNKLFVFSSKDKRISVVTREMISFFLFRIVSLVIDLVLMILLVERFHLNDALSKILVNILVIIFNYGASKLLIFKAE